jgi:hypothetical protein
MVMIGLIGLLVLSGCNLPRGQSTGADEPLLATMVALTMQALTPQASPEVQVVTPTATPSPVTATPTVGLPEISGKVCYRNDKMDSVVLYFENADSKQLIQVAVSRPVAEYKIRLSLGSYRIYGWASDFSIGVLSVTGLNLVVRPGQSQTGVDFCDWSHGPFDVPYPPALGTPTPTTGSVSGSIKHYPGKSGARLTVIAFNQSTKYWYYFQPLAGERTYRIDNLPPGTYQVVVYDKLGNVGGTTADIVVRAGENTVADITEWGVGFPDKPDDAP